jgi:hypothetical protein
MRTKKQLFADVLLGAGLHLIDSLREGQPDNVANIKERVKDTYDTASHRVGQATDALRGEEESHIFRTVSALVVGVGIGLGIGLLIAPTSGKETRADIANKVSDFGDKVREATGTQPQGATGTYGT